MARRSVKAPGKNGEGSLDEILTEVRDALNNWPSWSPFHSGTVRGDLAEVYAILGKDMRAEVMLPEVTYEANQLRATFRVAMHQAHNGNIEGANVTVKRGLTWMESYKLDGEPATVALSALAMAYHAMGQRQKARETLTEAKTQADAEKYNPSQPYPHLVKAYVYCKDYLGAFEVFQAPNAFYSFSLQTLFSEIAIGLYRAGYGEKIPALINDIIKQEHESHHILRPLIAYCLDERDDKMVMTCLELIPPLYQDECLKMMIETWRKREAHQKIEEALAHWQTSGATPATLARMYLSLDQGDKAADILERIVPEVLQHPPHTIAEKHAWPVCDICQTLGFIGRIETAFQCIETLLSERSRAEALLALIEGLYASDRFDKLVELFEHVKSWAHSIRDDSVKSVIIAMIAHKMMIHGRKKEAIPLFKEALKLGADIKRPASDQGQTRRRAVEEILRYNLQAGYLVGAFRASKKLRIGGQRDRLMHELLQAWVKTGDLAAILIIIQGIKTIEERAYAGVKALQTYVEMFPPPYTQDEDD